jgi:hypothetical protein
MKRVLVVVGLLAAFALPSLASATPLQANFVGAGCSISTCRYFTSSYSTAHYYYDRRTCSQWKAVLHAPLLERKPRGLRVLRLCHARARPDHRF